jgi:hypothetical protein
MDNMDFVNFFPLSHCRHELPAAFFPPLFSHQKKVGEKSQEEYIFSGKSGKSGKNIKNSEQNAHTFSHRFPPTQPPFQHGLLVTAKKAGVLLSNCDGGIRQPERTLCPKARSPLQADTSKYVCNDNRVRMT